MFFVFILYHHNTITINFNWALNSFKKKIMPGLYVILKGLNIEKWYLKILFSRSDLYLLCFLVVFLLKKRVRKKGDDKSAWNKNCFHPSEGGFVLRSVKYKIWLEAKQTWQTQVSLGAPGMNRKVCFLYFPWYFELGTYKFELNRSL